VNARRAWLRARRALILLRRQLRRALRIERTVYVEERVEEYRRYWEGAARKIGAEIHELGDHAWEVRRAGRHTRLSLSHVQLNDTVVNDLCSDKAFCYGVARAAGVPVPRSEKFTLDELGRAVAFLGTAAGPYVVKPARDTSAGIGVTTMVRTPRELEQAALLASAFCSSYIVEEMIAGESCRLLYVGGEFLHAVRRRGLRVAGDGRRTVEALVTAAGAPPLDANALWTLAAQGLAPRTVPPPGADVLVRSLPAGVTQRRELRTVYDEDVTHLVCPALRQEIARVVSALESELAGVDVITRDPGRSLAETGGVLLELNPAPGIHHHYVGEVDHRDHPVATKLLEYLLER
jgi:cyanophycin synthetase